MSCDNVYSASLSVRSVWQLEVCPRLVELGADSTLDISTSPSFGTAPFPSWNNLEEVKDNGKEKDTVQNRMPSWSSRCCHWDHTWITGRLYPCIRITGRQVILEITMYYSHRNTLLEHLLFQRTEYRLLKLMTEQLSILVSS